MAIKTSTFGGVHLTGEDAEKFRRQVKYGRPKKAAHQALAEGRKYLKEFEEKGYVTFYPLSIPKK